MVANVEKVWPAARLQTTIDKVESRPDRNIHALSMATFKNKPGDAYTELKWVPAMFREAAG